MRLSWLGVLSLLIIGAVCSTNIIKDEGSDHTIWVRTLENEVTKCHLKSPKEKIIKCAPGNDAASTEKFVIQKGSTTMRCSVTIKNLNEDDEGEWEISFTDAEGIGGFAIFNITVKPLNSPSADPIPDEEDEGIPEINKESEEEAETESENVKLLTLIEQVVKEGYSVDISLNKESFEEDCYVQKPKGELVPIDSELANVTAHKPSKFVSCRITVGPITEDLLGEWKLCGRSVEDDKMRCQPVVIAYNNNNPSANWHSIIEPVFNHPVHFGSQVNPGVMGSGNVLTCHVITPAGEDLVLTSDVTYPHIQRMVHDPWLCSVAISDIDESMLGDWAIYSRFRSQLTSLNEVRLPFNLHLYNPDDPYEQAYNVTSLPETTRVVNIGNTVTVQATSSGAIDDCVYVSPAGKRFNLDNATESTEVVKLNTSTNPTACHISIGPVDETLLGEWYIIGKFNNNNRYTEIRQPFNIILEDPANPFIEDRERIIENLPRQIVDTRIGATHSFSISQMILYNHESCHLRTPQGLQYILMEGFNVPHVEIINDSKFACGVQIKLLSEDLLGEWALLARSTRTSDAIERRLPFTIRVEETFSLGKPITIRQGNELFLRLPVDTKQFETCKLIGPDGEPVADAELDPIFLTSCGFRVKNVDQRVNGILTIVYGTGITYKGTVEVNVIDTALPVTFESEEWLQGSAIDKIVGPEDIVYCSLWMPLTDNDQQVLVYDGFGPCKIKIDRVTLRHQGLWRVVYAVQGSVLTQVDIFNVEVIEVEPLRVSTNISISSPSVTLTCSVPASYDVTGCKFRDPDGTILVASRNVGEEGFISYDSVIDHESSASSHACSLRFSNPDERYMGLWRCAVDTAQGTYYGFLDVRIPWISDDEYRVTEAVLKATPIYVQGLVGDPITLTCSANTAIRYCYFRSQNGTVYSVGPDMTAENYEYVGNGLDAGECGITIRGLQEPDSGYWTCNVGLAGIYHDLERSASIDVELQDKLLVRHFWNNGEVMVYPIIYDRRPIDYCRFVRFDGLGFTAYNPPEGYYVDRWNDRPCKLVVTRPTILDRRPWVVAVKLQGENGEIVARSPVDLLFIPGGTSFYYGYIAWVMVTMFGLLVMTVGVAMIPKKNRDWTYDRAGRIRDSFRRPRRETPPPAYTEEPVGEKLPQPTETAQTRETPANNPV